jgi:hypothetical protein
MNNLSSSLMLSTLNMSMWSARKHDKKVSQEVASNHNTDIDVGRYNKVLIARDAVEEIKKITNKVRTFHYENTLPWHDDGARILPNANFFVYSEKMREFREEFENAVNKFIANYPVYVQEARKRLNGLFKQEDYPSETKIKEKFGFRIYFDPLPTAEDFRVSLKQGDAERIKRDISHRLNQAQARAMNDLWQRLYDAVSKMSERLNDPDARFKNSLVGNLVELTQLLPKLNFLNDPKLEGMRKKVEDELCKHSPEILRGNSITREDTAKEADKILKAMAGYVGGV